MAVDWSSMVLEGSLSTMLVGVVSVYILIVIMIIDVAAGRAVIFVDSADVNHG